MSARDKSTNKEQKITITASSGLSEDDIKKMVDDAKSHEAEDKQRREVIEIKNSADSLAYSAEKMQKEYGEKLDLDTRAKIDQAVTKVREALKGENVDEIKSAAEALQTVVHEVTTKMYQAAGADAGAGEPGAPGGPEAGAAPDAEPKEGVVDAEYEVVDENKK